MSAMERREWQDTVTVIVTEACAPRHRSKPAPRRLVGRGQPWADQGVVARSVSGQITVEAMAFERRVENGFVHLKVRDADSAGSAVSRSPPILATARRLGARLSGADGAIQLPQPNDQDVYGVLRADGYSGLRLAPGGFRLWSTPPTCSFRSGMAARAIQAASSS